MKEESVSCPSDSVICNQCGSCCLHIGHYFKSFAKGEGSGVCKYLLPLEDGKRLCSIYNNRPGMCRVNLSSSEAIRAHKEACSLIRKNYLESELRLNS